MDLDPTIKEHDTLCSCAWLECDVHKDKLCSNKSVYVEGCGDPDCTNEHSLGANISDGVHICAECSLSLANVFSGDVVMIMGRLDKFAPKWMRPLNTFIAREYQRTMQIGRWHSPLDDVAAALAFGYTIIKLDTEKKIPTKAVIEFTGVKRRVDAIIRSYRPSPAATTTATCGGKEKANEASAG